MTLTPLADLTGPAGPADPDTIAALVYDDNALREAIFGGGIPLPPPTGIPATDNAAIAAAITEAGLGGRVLAQQGVYHINSLHNFAGIDLIGMGGGSNSGAPATTFLCTDADSGLEFSLGGGVSGYFLIDGDGVATLPFKRSGGTGANKRHFENITVKDGAQDNAAFHGAQNDVFVGFSSGNAARDLGYFDQGFGGALFLRCQWTGAGRYHHFYDDAVAGGPYASPADIHHIGGICEGASGTSIVKAEAGANVSYSDHAFYSVAGASGPMVDISGTVSGFQFHNPWIQSTPSTINPGSTGFKVSGTASITVTGRAIYQNLDQPMVVDGVGSYIYNKAHDLFYNCNGKVWPSGGATTAQVMSIQTGSRVSAESVSTDLVEISQNAARDRFLWTRDSVGNMAWYPGTATFTPDVRFLRRAAGALGVQNGQQHLLCTGMGTTAQRPAAASALAGGLYLNSDTLTVDYCDGTLWHTSAKANEINFQTGTTYTPVITDAGKMITLTNAAAITLTIPTNASVAFVVGTELNFASNGAGQVTMVGAGGVTLASRGGRLKSNGTYSVFGAKYLGTNIWQVYGDLTT